MTFKSSVSLTDQQAAFARRLVAEGRYSSLSAVIQQGLEELRKDEEKREADLAVKRAFFAQRMAEPAIPMEEFEERVKAMLGEESRRLGLED